MQNKEYKIQTYIHCGANVAQNVTYRICALIKKQCNVTKLLCICTVMFNV